MTTESTTEYGFRTAPKRAWGLRETVTNWPDASGFVTPLTTGRRSRDAALNVTDGDLVKMHEAAEAYNTLGRDYTTVVVERDRIVTVGTPRGVPAPPKIDPELEGLAHGSVVRATMRGNGHRGLFVLTTDTDDLPWRGLEGS